MEPIDEVSGSEDWEGENEETLDFCPVGSHEGEEHDEEDDPEAERLEQLRTLQELAAQKNDDKDKGDESGFDTSDDDSDEDSADKDMAPSFSELERARPPPEDEEMQKREGRQKFLLDKLQQHRLFRKCNPHFLQTLLKQATRVCLAPNEDLKMTDGGSLYIIETGALRVSTGNRTSILGCGSILNGAGFLKLHTEANAYRPRRVSFTQHKQPKSTRANGFDVQGYFGPPPSIYCDFQGVPKEPEQYEGPDSVKINFFSTCPYACQSNKTRFLSGKWLEIVVQGGRKDEHPAQAQTSNLPEGGATVLALPPLSNTEIWGKKGQEADVSNKKFVPFEQNCEQVVAIWQELMAKFIPIVFPAAPVEAALALAEIGERTIVEKGQEVVTEGEVGEEGDRMVLVIDGVAMVLKKVRVVRGVDQLETIGRLRAGAIVGDISMITGDKPRPATVRAKTDLDVINFQARPLLNVIARFPGLLSSSEERLRDAAECIKERLLTRTEVASSLNLFSGCDLSFVNNVANHGERKLLYSGEIFIKQGSEEGTLWVVEHGRATIEVAGLGTVAEKGAGFCFGERTLLGIAKQANATVKVFSPFALCLSIPREVLDAALEQCPEEKAHFEMLKASPQDGRISGSKVRHVELFRGCGTGFLEALNSEVYSQMFLHGQTIVVEGEVEEDPKMFVLTGGIALAESNGRPLARMSPGATWGEMAMLGLSKERGVTIRAVTLCFIMSVPSSIFFKALEEFPSEQERFEKALQGDNGNAARVVWPCLRGESSRLLYLLDLYAEKFTCEAGDRRFGKPPLNKMAILILSGECSVIDENGKEVAVLTSGNCFNESVLVGARVTQTDRLIPLTSCDFRLVSRETWNKVMAEFPNELEKIRTTVLRYMGNQAEKRLGYEPGSPALLHARSSFFASVSMDFTAKARSLAEIRIIQPGQDLVPRKHLTETPELEYASEEDKQELYVLLQGTATSWRPYIGEREIKAGEVIGESVFMGASRVYSFAVKAKSLCLVQVLKRDVVFDAMNSFGGRDKEMLDLLRAEMQPMGSRALQRRLSRTTVFKEAEPDFVAALARVPDVVLFAPGSVIVAQGEKCKLGESQFFMVLTGRVTVEGVMGVQFATVGPGQVFGEVGAFGVATVRSAGARAWKEGLVCCQRFDGGVIVNAMEQCPGVRDTLMKVWQKIESDNQKIEQARRNWIKNVVLPALASTPLLAGCPRDFLQLFAIMLKDTSFKAGQTIVSLGDEAKGMMILLQGSANIIARGGECIGVLKQGAAFGEINALGLLDNCMASLVAATSCDVLVLPNDCLDQVLHSGIAKTEGVGDAFKRLVASRRAQIAKGTPICDLNLMAAADDVRVRAIAGLSEHIELQPHEVYLPIPDDDPSGPYMIMLVSGRCMLEVGAARHTVLQIPAGSIFLEGLTAQYQAFLSAESRCEVYRIRQHDFEMAVSTNPPAQNDWLWRFKVRQRTFSERLFNRLQSIQGLLDLATPNEKDHEIEAWKTRRKMRMDRAESRKGTNEAPATNGVKPLPQLSQTTSLASAHEYSQGRTERSAVWQGIVKGKPGLMAYPSCSAFLQLPRLPMRRASRGGSLYASKSTPSLSKQEPSLEDET
eukprot:TRINITY_DN5698_c0_g1_i2.p1 TRINITY_DN5698_c0_g1~~TRINITY_DN5698_c0_g1_i2.p1  ORF type:complete len:1605 (+),score=366.13 TRINITY_DN5698_c0_g1_i2:141-4955(+)